MPSSHASAWDLTGRRLVGPLGVDWQPMRLDGRVLEGVTMCALVEAPEHWRSYWMKMEAGSRSVMHRHSATEMLVVVAGAAEDCDGAVFRLGDAVVYPVGSTHLLYSPEGCTLLVVESLESTRE